MDISKINWTFVENELFCLLHGEMPDNLHPVVASRLARRLARLTADRVRLVLQCQVEDREEGDAKS